MEEMAIKLVSLAAVAAIVILPLLQLESEKRLYFVIAMALCGLVLVLAEKNGRTGKKIL